jgi:hypothetical protein
MVGARKREGGRGKRVRGLLPPSGFLLPGGEEG